MGLASCLRSSEREAEDLRTNLEELQKDLVGWAFSTCLATSQTGSPQRATFKQTMGCLVMQERHQASYKELQQENARLQECSTKDLQEHL